MLNTSDQTDICICDNVERRREIRLRRSHLLENPIEAAITYKIAIGREQHERSFALVWDAYVKVGLQKQDDSGIRFTKYHLLPTTKVFVAVYRPELISPDPNFDSMTEPGEIIGTLTLVMDSPMGLPLDEVCGQEIHKLRDRGRKLAEVIALAINPKYRKCNLMMRLFKLMYGYAIFKGVTDICASVTDRHIQFYKDILLFTPLGEKQSYSSANWLPVQCHYLDILEAPERYKQVYSHQDFDCDLLAFFLKDPRTPSRPQGEGYPWSEEMIAYFRANKPEIFACLTDKDIGILKGEYAGYNLCFPEVREPSQPNVCI
jgi:hypothetical protein